MIYGDAIIRFQTSFCSGAGTIKQADYIRLDSHTIEKRLVVKKAIFVNTIVADSELMVLTLDFIWNSLIVILNFV